MNKILVERLKHYKNLFLSRFENNIVNIVLILVVFFVFQILGSISYINLFINANFVTSLLFLLTIYLFKFRVKQLIYVAFGLLIVDIIVRLLGGDTSLSEKIGNLLYILIFLCILLSLPLLNKKE